MSLSSRAVVATPVFLAQKECTSRLLEITKSGCVVIDNEWRILREYLNKLSPTGQPGPGDAFLKWLLTNQANPERCQQVQITPKPEDALDFEEFPRHPGLTAFDRSDRKFVAIALACAGGAVILEAADSKWWGWADALRECGVQLDFLCPEEISARYQKKIGT